MPCVTAAVINRFILRIVTANSPSASFTTGPVSSSAIVPSSNGTANGGTSTGSGETVVPFRYDWAGSFGQYGFDEEVAMVKTGMDRDRIPLYTPCPTALIDRDGERITPVYGFMTPIVGGVSFVNDGRKFHGVGRDLLASDGKWGCVDRRGRLVVACEYELAYPLFDRFAFVRKDGKWGVLDRRGRLIVPCRYDAGYYRAGIYVLDTLFDTQDTPPTDGVNPAVRGEFEEGRIYMIADGCAEAFDMKGRKIGK